MTAATSAMIGTPSPGPRRCGRGRCGARGDHRNDEQAVVNPILIAEVLSDGTEGQDRGEKWRHYQCMPSRCSYVRVSQSEARVEVFRREGEAWRYEMAGPGQRLVLDDEGLVLDVDALYRSALPR